MCGGLLNALVKREADSALKAGRASNSSLEALKGIHRFRYGHKAIYARKSLRRAAPAKPRMPVPRSTRLPGSGIDVGATRDADQLAWL